MAESISAIKTHLQTITQPDDNYLIQLATDERKGVQSALKSWQRQYERATKAKEALQEHLAIEHELWEGGVQYIAGVDEVGRGPLAGPVIAAAVILPVDFDVVGVNDSKQLTDKRREELFPLIMDQALAVEVGIVDAETIDEVNIYQASRLAMKAAIEKLDPQPQQLLIDAMTVDLDIPQEKLIKGDARSASIGAASIIAKVTRDHMMKGFATIYPGYGFENNAGYGTKEHLAGLKKLGVTPIHRKTFAPVKAIAEK
ncbi:ribonuclease HII [Periweissella cryptocerci]|uniref:Ribonuclease HII n=1 Tax=Periweissella cryptocerci TaxID=2506420 RepID=A0A4P6YWR6_9LACO|nr:ribonuclease HII [Periweissella cryptocerci]QBO37349.1 ribonuclease HII [Periweissella cryptocerci]